DLDLLVVASRRLGTSEKGRMVDALRPISRRERRPPGWRPLEVSVVAQPDVRPWRYPPLLDLQYGEWLGDVELGESVERGPVGSPDLAVVLTMARATGRVLFGSHLSELLD